MSGLCATIRALHDFLAANARRLLDDDDDLLNANVSSPALERYREERAKLARLDRLEREQRLVSRDEIRQGLGQIAGILRTAGDVLQRQYGNGAVEILNEALDDAVEAIAQLCGDAADNDDQQEPDDR